MNRIARGIGTALAAGALLLGVTGCSGGGKPDLVPTDTGVEPAVTVHVSDNRYEPAKVEIKAGEAVRWVFDGPGDHDVVASDGSFVSELQSGGEYLHVFDDAGQFMYDCSIHPEMIGTVTVG